MGHYEYLTLLGLCLAITLPLEVILAARVYRRFHLVALSMIPMLLVFVAWDILGILRGHWWYTDSAITGIHFWVVPLEELLFFIVVPLCGILTYEAVGNVMSFTRRMVSRYRHESSSRSADASLAAHHGDVDGAA